MFTNFTATQINRLAQRLSEAPLGRSASVAAAADRFERLLAARIGIDRAPIAIKAILTAPGFETAEGRLVAEIEADEPEAGAEPTTAEKAAPVGLVIEPATEAPAASEPAGTPRRRRDADLEAKARQGELPPPPDFSAPTHARFRNKLEGLIALAEKGDAEALMAVAINPVSSSPKALARYRDLCLIAIAVRASVAARRSPANSPPATATSTTSGFAAIPTAGRRSIPRRTPPTSALGPTRPGS